VAEAVVALREQAGEKRLVGYVVGRDGAAVDVGKLRAGLKQQLPDYMIPSAWKQLAELPLTANGKLDRRSLPEPEGEQASGGSGPRTPVEEIIAGIWCEVLKRERVGVEDNFFDLGGHSLLATQVVARVRAALSADIGVRTVFEAPTVAGLAEAAEQKMRAGQRAELPPLEPVDRSGALPLSFAQEGVWTAQLMDHSNTAFNLAWSYRISGEIAIDALQSSINEIVRRHEALRTRYLLTPAGVCQQVIDATRVPLHVIDISGISEQHKDGVLENLVRIVSGLPIDLEHGLLFHSALIRVAPLEHAIVLRTHHITGDGWSLTNLLNELELAYRQRTGRAVTALPKLTLQYGDYAVWESRLLTGGFLDGHLRYWQRQLAGARSITLPVDKRDAIRRAACLSFTISPELTASVHQMAARTASSTFIILLAALKVLIARMTSDTDIIIASDISCRFDVKLEPLIGLFVSTAPLRTNLDGNPTFEEVVDLVRETFLGAYLHLPVPPDQFVRCAGGDLRTASSRLFDIKLTLQNTPPPQRPFGGELKTSEFVLPDANLKNKLEMFISPSGDRMMGTLHYNAGLFTQETIQQFISRFLGLLEAAGSQPDRSIWLYPLGSGSATVSAESPADVGRYEYSRHLVAR